LEVSFVIFRYRALFNMFPRAAANFLDVAQEWLLRIWRKCSSHFVSFCNCNFHPKTEAVSAERTRLLRCVISYGSSVRGLQEFQQICHLLDVDSFFEVARHGREVGDVHLLDVFALDNVFFSVLMT